MKLIDMKNWSTLFPAGDQEDMVKGEMMLCKNLEPKSGKLVKTHGPGVKLDQGLSETGGGKHSMFGTFIHPQMNAQGTSGSVHLRSYVNAVNNALFYGWDPVQERWEALQYFAPNYLVDGPDRGSYWYQKVQRGNPLILYGDEFRCMCGKLSEVNSEPALPLWCGYIKREFFCEPDGGYSPSENFYAYTAPLLAPDIDITVLEVPGGPYNPEGTKLTIEALSAGDDTIKVHGLHPEISSGDYVRILDSVSNDNVYRVIAVSFDAGNTVMGFDTDFSDIGAEGDETGYVLPFAEGETKWYKFSYIYDGVQESLLTEDPIAVKMDSFDDILPRLEWTIADQTAHNFRITALVVYRSDTRDGIYNRIQIVDYIRPADQIFSGSTSAYTGHSYVYVPGLSDYAFSNGVEYSLYLKYPDGTWNQIVFTWNTGASTVFFKPETPAFDYTGYDLWDCAWKLQIGGTVKISGASGAYAGENTVILLARHTAGGEGDAAGGVLYLGNGDTGVISGAATDMSGNRTKFTTNPEHKLKPGDMIEIYGYDDAKGYNGTYMVLSVPTSTTFIVDAAFTTDTAGSWVSAGRERVIDDNYRAAFHVTRPYKTKVIVGTEKYVLMKPQNGLFYYEADGNEITVRFYDNGITAGIPHYLAGEKSIHVNGDCAVVVQDILFQGNLYLEPGGANEERSNYISHSVYGSLDVNPVSNIKRIKDKKGGKILVQLELEGNVVSVTGFGMTHTIIDNPADSATWKHIPSKHNLGTVAKLGCISAVGSIFTCALDGIYRVKPNNLARSDKTPLDVMRITDDIENIYLAMSFAQKQAIVAGYDALKSEVLFSFNYHQDSTEFDDIYAYDVVKGTWREVSTTVVPAIFFDDEEGNLLVYDENGLKVNSFAEDASDPRATLRIPYQLISDVRDEVVRDVKITYLSASNLKVNVYANHAADDIPTGLIVAGVEYLNSGYTTVTYNGTDYSNGDTFTGISGLTTYTTVGTGRVLLFEETPVDTFELPATARVATYHYTPRTRCMKFALEITEDFVGHLKVAQTSFGTSYLIVARHGGSYPNTELHRIRIWHD